MQTLSHSEFASFAKDYSRIKVEVMGEIYLDVTKAVILKTIKALQANVTFKIMVEKDLENDKGIIFIEKMQPTLFDEEVTSK